MAARIVTNRSELEKLDIEVVDSNGNLRSTYDILKDLKPAWDRMTDSERTNLGQKLAGQNQFKVLAAVMQNFSQATEAYETALDSAGSAAEENSRFMGGLEAKVTALNAAFQQMSTAVVDSGLVSGVLDVLTGLAEFGATDVGSTIAKIALSLGTIVGLLGVIKAGNYLSALIGLTSVFKDIGAFIGLLGSSGLGALGALTGGELVAVAAGVTAIGVAISKNIKEATSYETRLEQYAETVSKIKDIESESTDIMRKVVRMEATDWDRKRLRYLTDELIVQQKLEGIAKRRAQRAWDSSQSKFTQEIGVVDETGRVDYYTEAAWAVESYSRAISDLQQKYENAEITQEELTTGLQDLLATQKEHYEEIQKAKAQGLDVGQKAEEFVALYEEQAKALNQVDDSTSNLTKDMGKLSKSQREAYDAMRTFVEGFAMGTGGDELDDKFKAYASTFATLKSEFEAGRIGSNALADSLAVLVDTETYGQFVTADFAGKTALLKEIMPQLTKYFADADSAGKGFFNVLAGMAGPDGIVAIDNIKGLADQMNLSLGAMFSMIEAGKIWGYDFKLNAEDIISSLEEIGLTMEDGVVDWDQFSQHLGEIGYTEDQITAVKNALEGIDGVTLSGATASVEESAGSLDDATTAANTYKDALTALATTWEVTVHTTYNETGTPPVTQSNAEGTDNAKAGLSLVNEEGPEIIQSGNSAYIANGGKPGLAYLNKGDMVFNASETKSILSGSGAYNQLINGGIASHRQESGSGTVGHFDSALHAAWNTKELTLSGGGSSSSSSSSLSMDDFDSWLAEKKHALNMDLITEEEYYNELEKMYKKYLDAGVMDQEDAWSYEEEIYKYRKQALDDEAEAMEKINALAKAEATRLKVFSGGQWQYMGDYDAIASAVADMDETTLNKYMGIKNSDSNITVSSAGNNSYTFSIDSLSLPDVNDGSAFVSGLKQYALQYVYKNSNSNSTTRSKGRGK